MMSSGPDDDRRQAADPTFADVMNGFSFDSARAPRRRRWGRPRGPGQEPVAELHTDGAAEPESGTLSAVPAARSVDLGPDPAPPPVGASAVRPYAWTRGRTKSGLELAIEALVSTSARGREQMATLQMEHRAVAELCEQARSVAEVAALLKIPLGVARVLLGDMAGIGVVTVHQTASSTGNVPDLALMERVLSGLRRL